MTITIAVAENNKNSLFLSEHINTNRQEIIFTVEGAINGEYITKDFKSFSAACKRFDKLCEAHNITDKITR